MPLFIPILNPHSRKSKSIQHSIQLFIYCVQVPHKDGNHRRQDNNLNHNVKKTKYIIIIKQKYFENVFKIAYHGEKASWRAFFLLF
jgi:hypothetical protein